MFSKQLTEFMDESYTDNIKPKLSDFLLDLHRSLAHQESSKILDISTGMPVGDPDLFSGRFSRTLMHQDLSTSLRKKSLNSGLIYSIFH